MSSTKIVPHTSTADDIDLSGLDEIICMDRAKNKAIQQAKIAEQGHTGKKGASREPVIALANVAWDKMFKDITVNIPETRFMNQLEQAITKEQFQQTTKDIVKALTKSKEDFCKGN